MALAFSLKEFDYVLVADRELIKEGKLKKGEETVFRLRVLSAEQNAEIEDLMTFAARGFEEDGKITELVMNKPSGTVSVKILRIGLVGWARFPDEREKDIPFKHPGGSNCAWDNIDRIHPDDRHELADAVTEGAKVTEDDEKNSPSAPGSERGE